MTTYHKKQYNEISELLRKENASDSIIMRFAHLFSRDNKNFDFIRFLEASNYRGN